MFSFARLLTVTALAIVVSGGVVNIVPPAHRGQPTSSDNKLTLDGTQTDADTIVSTANSVDQKGGPTADAPPNQPVTDTVVTAVDGTITDAGTSSSRRSIIPNSDVFRKRSLSDYDLVFSGTGTGPNDRDASIQGTAYLTYTVVSNATYNVDACLSFCDSVPQCVFANLFYEFNNELLDVVFNEHSNLKCAIYADVHTAVEKTNFGGQQSYPAPADLTYIQQSSGYAAKTLFDPVAPDGYELVFGPTNGANNAPGYMGFAFLDKYDVDACATECNNRGADSNGGACQYFNIWRAVVDGVPTTYTCSMYYIVADASSAVNTGQGDLQVTYSRGYKRKNLLPDGGFEGFPCSGTFCFGESYPNWIGTSPAGGSLDATFFFYAPYAHSGHGSALLGSATGVDTLSGTLKPAQALQTIPGKTYQIALFQNSAFSGPTLEAPAFFDILWNGNVVQTIHPGYSAWTFVSVQVTAVGNDLLSFHGGRAPAWTFLDDISVWQL